MDIIDTFCVSRERSLTLDPGICFIITKSDNKNMVVYSYDKENCLTAYWQTWEEIVADKPAIYQLSMLEKSLAFGFSGPRVEENILHITLNGYPSLPITIVVSDEKCQNIGCHDKNERIGSGYTPSAYTYLGTYIDTVINYFKAV